MMGISNSTLEDVISALIPFVGQECNFVWGNRLHMQSLAFLPGLPFKSVTRPFAPQIRKYA